MNRANQYRDKEKAKKTRREQKRRYYGKTAFLYPRRNYTEEEDAAILAHEKRDTELSLILQRSVGSIQKRRCKLKSS